MNETTNNKLTNREIEVLILVRVGMTNKEIALKLGISPSTVHKHLQSCYRKLGAVNRVTAVVNAIQLGIIELSADQV